MYFVPFRPNPLFRDSLISFHKTLLKLPSASIPLKYRAEIFLYRLQTNESFLRTRIGLIYRIYCLTLYTSRSQQQQKQK